MKRHIVPILLLLILSFWSVRPLVSKGFFPMHDDTQVARVVVMGNALRNGQFPVRWVSDLGYGYGYPLFNFYGPIPYYVGGFLAMWGISGLVATKIMFIAGMILSGITMYAWVSSELGIAAGLLASVFYMYAPYHAVQVYVRGAVGEFWALAFLPLVAFGLFSLKTKKKKAVLWGGIGLAGVILSHTIIGYTTTVLIVFSLAVYSMGALIKRAMNWSMLSAASKMVVIGLGISAFFWLPAIAEMHWTNVSAQIGSTADFRDHFVCLSQLWNSPWGFGGSAKGCVDGMSFKLGKLHVLLAALGALVWVVRRKSLHHQKAYITVGLGVTALSIFFMLQLSQFLWVIFPFAAYIQYPWRFLMYATLGLSLLAGVIVVITDRKWIQFVIATAAIIGVIGTNAKLFRGHYVIDRPASAYETTEELRFRVSKISDEYLPLQIKRPSKQSDVVGDTLPPTVDYSVDTDVDTETYARFVVTIRKDALILIQRAYFPGWQYLVNGKLTTPTIVDGLPYLPVSTGSSIIELHFFNTPIRSIANLISVITVGMLFFLYGKKQHKTIT